MLEGVQCSLVAVEPSHYPYLYDLMTSGRNATWWRFHGAYVPQREFVDVLHADVLAQFVVIDRLSARPSGYVVAYGANLRNGLCSIGVLVDQRVLGAGFGGEAGVLLIDYLFNAYPIRKIYAEIPEFTVASVEPRMQGLFEREGVLRKHFIADGVYWDQHIFATYREMWVGRKESWLAERALSRPIDLGDRSTPDALKSRS